MSKQIPRTEKIIFIRENFDLAHEAYGELLRIKRISYCVKAKELEDLLRKKFQYSPRSKFLGSYREPYEIVCEEKGVKPNLEFSFRKYL